ncbi:hypothetical protein, partial [Brevibacillus agri]|uniref:hypothetical protein n=1 Tax=Brevibacillus agri TaxID=51101 RepID=UPI003D1C40C4
PESTTFGRGFAFSPEPGSDTPSREPKKLQRFRLFSRHTKSADKGALKIQPTPQHHVRLITPLHCKQFFIVPILFVTDKNG